jgi:hypothetical protein
MKKILTLALAIFGSLTSFAIGDGNIDTLGTPLIVDVMATNTVNRPNNFSYSMPSGDSTGLFVVFQGTGKGSTADYPDSVFYGGVALSPSINTIVFQNASTTDKLNIFVFFLNDSASNTRSGNTISVKYNQASQVNQNYMFTVFTLDEVNQTPPIMGCAAQQTGGNISGDSLACGTGGTITAGDLLLVLGGVQKSAAGPLSSNYPQNIVNGAYHGMWASVFVHEATTTQYVTPYAKTSGGNGGRFIVLGTIVHNINILGGGGTNLPVKLTKFEGRNQSNGNNVSWTTANETNLRNFEVQMSADGKDFTTVGYVSPNTGGNTTVPQEYSYVDQVRAATSYYRLKTVNMDGTFAYSKIVSVSSSVRTAPDMSVYPNPSTGTFTVNINTQDGKVRVMNSMGQSTGYTVIEEATAPRSMTLKLNNPTPGFYYVISESEGTSSTAKVFVQ